MSNSSKKEIFYDIISTKGNEGLCKKVIIKGQIQYITSDNKRIPDFNVKFINGYNEDGYDISGFDCNGYDKNGYNINGFDKNGSSKPIDYKILGKEKVGIGDHQGAIDDYTNSINIEPYNVEGFHKKQKLKEKFEVDDYIHYSLLTNEYNNKGKNRLLLGDYTEAIENFNKGIELENGTNIEPYLYRCISKYKIGNYDSAIEDGIYYLRGYDRLQNWDDFGYYYFSNTSHNYKIEDDDYENPNKMIEHYNNIFELDPKNALYGIAFLEYKIGNFKSALQNIKKSLELKEGKISFLGDNRFSQLILGKINFELGDYQGSLEVFNNILKSSPTSYAAIIGKGLIYYKLGKQKLFKKEFDYMYNILMDTKRINNLQSKTK